MASETKHTPGPWEVRAMASGSREIKAGHYGVGEAWDVNGNPENEANARLIAAAPEMFEALDKIAAMRTWNECAQSVPQGRPTKADIANQRDECISAARAALAKAGA